VRWIRYVGLDGGSSGNLLQAANLELPKYCFIKRRQSVKKSKQPEIKRIGNHNLKQLIDVYLVWAEQQKSYQSKKGFIDQLQTF
jgi:hypothetical protein